MQRLKILTMALILWSINVSLVFSAGTLSDQYKQMGGIAAVNEKCFGTKNIETVLFKQLGVSLYSNPEMGRMMYELLGDYFEAYEVGKDRSVLWNGTLQSYNTKSFDCDNESDVRLIKHFEQQFISSLEQKD